MSAQNDPHGDDAGTPPIAESVADLTRQMGEAWTAYVEADLVRHKALREYNRLFDLVTLAEMRAKRAARNDGGGGGS